MGLSLQICAIQSVYRFFFDGEQIAFLTFPGLTVTGTYESVVSLSHTMNTPDHLEIDNAICRIIDGEKQAIGTVYQWFGKLLYSVAIKILRSENDAEECVQDAFVALWNHSETLKGNPQKVLPWLIRTTRNKAIDQLRKTHRRLPTSENNRLENAHGEIREPVDQDNALDALVGSERATHVRRAIETLPENQRNAIRLAYFKGLSQSEIAKNLNESLGTIKSRIRLAMMRLRKELEGENV